MSRRKPSKLAAFKTRVDGIAPTPRWFKEIHAEAKRKGLDKLTMRQINDEIAAYRRDKNKSR